MSGIDRDAIASYKKDRDIARESTARLESLPPGKPVQLTLDGNVVADLPYSVIDIIIQVLRGLARGEAVTVLATDRELTTQQAADLLNVSRQYATRLMDRGLIPCRKVGRHRRVRASDLLEYARRREERQENALRQLTADAQDLGIDY